MTIAITETIVIAIIIIRMEIEVQDLINANIPKQFIDIYLPGLNKIFEGREIPQLKALITGDTLTNSHKRLLAQYTKQQYCKVKKVSEDQFDKVIGEAMTAGIFGGALGGLGCVGIQAVMRVLGFGAAGVVRTSLTTGMIGGAEGGSLLAASQSLGAKSLFLSPKVALGLIAVGAGIGLYYYFAKVDGVKLEEKGNQQNCSSELKQEDTPGH